MFEARTARTTTRRRRRAPLHSMQACAAVVGVVAIGGCAITPGDPGG
jgi:hypothetical protein